MDTAQLKKVYKESIAPSLQKQFNYSSNDESMDTYIIITSNNNTNEAYIMNLDEQMLTMIKNYIPRQVQI